LPHDHDDHGHSHGIGEHSHAPADFGRAFATGAISEEALRRFISPEPTGGSVIVAGASRA
jgi:hypothetical protein